MLSLTHPRGAGTKVFSISANTSPSNVSTRARAFSRSCSQLHGAASNAFAYYFLAAAVIMIALAFALVMRERKPPPICGAAWCSR